MAVSNITTTLYSRLHFTGLSGSGFDTDTLVEQLMKVERAPLDKLTQKRQLTQWKSDAYRDVISKLRGFKDEYLNVLKPAQNMLSPNSYKKYTVTSTDSNVVTVSANAEAAAGSHKIIVNRLATADKAVSGGGVTDPLVGRPVSSFDLSGKKFMVTLDGVTKEITMDNYSFDSGDNSSDIVSKASTGLQALLDKAFGEGKITATYNSTNKTIQFEATGGANKITLVNGFGNDGLSSLGFTGGDSNRLNIGASLDALQVKFANNLTFDSDGKLKFTINGKAFTFDGSTSLFSMMNTISSDSDAKVNMQYDEITDRFVLTAKQLGDGNNIVIGAEQGGNFFGDGGVSGISTGSAATEEGTDALVTIDGVDLVRSNNSFTVNGITYNLLKADPGVEKTVELVPDVDSVYNSIKTFIDKYNELIDSVNTTLSDKYDRSYQPLTSDQRDAMSEDDIKKWEEKAKTGLLKNDPILQNMISSMRLALFEKVDGVDIDLKMVGITTGSWQEKGKLHIDETTLKKAIRENPDAVMSLFSKSSTSTYGNVDLTAEQRTQRHKEEGLFQRISDILDDNIRTNRALDGTKGLLLEKAGITNDASQYTNLLYKEMEDYDKKINSLVDKLTEKQNKYYEKFAAMETALSRMNAQSSWLASQLGTSK